MLTTLLFYISAKKIVPYMKGDDKNYYDHYFGDSIYLYAGDYHTVNGYGSRDRISAVRRFNYRRLFHLSRN